MALNLVKKGAGKNGTNVLVHHRNPSGFRNKVNWLMSESLREPDKMRELFHDFVYKGPERSEMWWSWVNAYAVARFKLQEEGKENRMCEYYRQKCLEVKERLEKGNAGKHRD